jgi:hypothetical protein
VFPVGPGGLDGGHRRRVGQGRGGRRAHGAGRHSLHTARCCATTPPRTCETLNRRHAQPRRRRRALRHAGLRARPPERRRAQRAGSPWPAAGHPPASSAGRRDRSRRSGPRRPARRIFPGVVFTTAEVVLEAGRPACCSTRTASWSCAARTACSATSCCARARRGRRAGRPARWWPPWRARRRGQEGEARDDLALLALRVRP